MARMIVTKTKVVKDAYRMKESGHSLYSYEELCYYIYSRMSLWLMEKERVGLTAWLLECGVVVDDIDYLTPQEAGAKILAAGTYFRVDEKRQIVDRMKRYDTFPIALVEKDKGDLYLSYGKIKKAYFSYEKAAFSLQGNETDEWKSSLYHNMGLVCSRFFYWKEARAWLDQAMECMERPETKIASDFVDDMLKKDWTLMEGAILADELEKKKQEFLNEL